MHDILDIIFASIQIFGSLDLKGTLGIAGFALPVDEDIRINIKVTDLRIIADYKFGQSLTNPNGLRISDFDVKIFVGDVKVDNWDESIDIVLNTFSNNFLGSLSVLLRKELRPYVNDMLDRTLKLFIDTVLENKTMTQLIDFFNFITEKISITNCTVNA
ncbi:hypothetical protein ACLKA6_019874 [Drosophila palustris]